MNRSGSPALRTITRAQFIAELGPALRPGDHVTLIGPTGRGKSTLMGQLIPAATQFDDAVVLAVKARDPAYASIGHPTRTWPPRLGFIESFRVLFGLTPERHRQAGPKTWRLEIPVRRPEHFALVKVEMAKVLRSVLARSERPRRTLIVVVDDSRFVCDQMKLAPLVTACLIIARSKKATIVNNFQAPRWVPREGLDQMTHALLWRNRDRDVVKRLAEVSGDLDIGLVETTLRTLDYHEFLWVDGRTNQLTIVRAK